MCCKEQTNMILHWGMYFYKLLYNWGLCSEATIGLQLKYFVRLQQFCESSREMDWRGGDAYVRYVEKACEQQGMFARQ